jgi:TctA family transporter
MDILHNIMFGFGHALTWTNLMYCAIGCIIGTLIGLLPGLGPLATISLLLPLTYSLPTDAGLIMLAGIYYGAQYGENVSAITMKIPHASSIVACIDGYAMTLKGKAGLALLAAGMSSFIGGAIATVVIATLAPSLAQIAFLFSPADYCALILLGFASVSHVSSGSMLAGLGMALVGALLGSIGTDFFTGVPRFTMGQLSLIDGVTLVSVALGCFGIAEVSKNLDKRNTFSPFSGKIDMRLSWVEFKRIVISSLRGSAIGSVLGLLPGGGPAISQFGAYAVEKKVSKYRDEIGQGSIEGVSGQAAANEAASRTSFIPLLSVGIPENPTMALMMSAFIMKGVQPGPVMMTQHPHTFWGLVASMWIGNCFLLFLNVPMVKQLLSVLRVPYAVLYPTILLFCCIGAYSVHSSTEDIYVMVGFGILGYLCKCLQLDVPPLMLGFILGPMLEENFRRATTLSHGSFMVFVERPISATILGVLALLVCWNLLRYFQRRVRTRDVLKQKASV